METNSGGFNWPAFLMVSNEMALQWYSTLSQKPVAVASSGDLINVGPTGMRVSGQGGLVTLLVVGGLLWLVFGNK